MSTKTQNVAPILILNNALVNGTPPTLLAMARGVVDQISRTVKKAKGTRTDSQENGAG